MFGYTPYQDPYRSSYLRPSSYASTDPYFRALAEEQAARNQYAAALRAQEEACERAARARRLQNAYRPSASPYNSYFDEEEDETPYYANPYARGYRGLDPYEMELERERRRRELMQRERERELELQRQREMERLRLIEEERRRLLEEERRRRELAAAEEERERRRRAEAAAQDFFRNYERGRMFPDEQAYYDKMGPKRSTSTFPNSGAGAPGLSTQTRKVPSFSPNAAHRRTASAQPTEGTRIPIRTPSPKPTQTQPKPASPKPQYTKEQTDAALKIQHFLRAHYHRHKALKQISTIESHFDSLKSAFTFPAIIDFALSSTPESSDPQIVSVSTSILGSAPSGLQPQPTPPSLPYTPHNHALHAYDHNLGEVLTQLDEVESGGDAKVRERRKEVVRRVQEEQARVEEWRVGVWAAWVSQNGGKVEEQKEEAQREPEMETEKIVKDANEGEREDVIVEDAEREASRAQADVPETLEPESKMEVEEHPAEPLEPKMAVEEPLSSAAVDSAAAVQTLLEASPSPITESPSVFSEPQTTTTSAFETRSVTPFSSDDDAQPVETNIHSEHVEPTHMTSPVVEHASDDQIEVEYIEDVPTVMDVDEDEEAGVPAPPVKIKVEVVEPELDVIPEEPLLDVTGSEAVEKHASVAEGEMVVDGDGAQREVEEQPEPVVEELLESALATTVPAPPSLASPGADGDENMSEPETEAPRTPPPPEQGERDGKLVPLYDVDERSMDGFVML